MNEIDKYIKKIVDQTDCTKAEKEDLTEELTTHLEILLEEQLDKGLSENEAIQESIKQFGSENFIGEQLQQAMFPYRRELLVILGLSFIVLSFSIFYYVLFFEQEALNTELIINVFVGSSLLLITLSNTFNSKRKLLTNCIITLAIICSVLNGLTIGFTEAQYLTTFISICNYVLILGFIIMLYIITLRNGKANLPLPTLRKQIHAVNITAGLVLLGVSMFFIAGFLMMVGWNIMMLVMLIPLCIWLYLYILQIKYYAKIGKLVYGLFALYALFTIAVLSYFIYPTLWL